MANEPQGSQWKTLDKDLNRISQVELATTYVARPLVAPGIALAFMVLAGIIAAVFFGFQPSSFVVIAAAVFGAYMAVNIGANDVANAVGPLAAIVHAAEFGEFAAKVSIPNWVMIIGAFGISFGLFLFGPKLIRMVGEKITKLNPMRAYCVALSAAITVIVASWLGLPVSSTHIAVGGIFGVGFYREWHAERRLRKTAVQRPPEKRIAPEERRRRKLVRRSHFMTIVAAWVITVPAAALMSAAIFYALNTLSS